MYKPIPGGSSMMIGEDDLAIEVFLPPVGKVWNHDLGILEDCVTICRSTTKSEQYWEVPTPPDNYANKRKKELALQETDPDYVDEELNAYRSREWHRRLYGVWVMMNGTPVYFTGLYYYYLAHWKIDIGPPDFKLAHLHKFYFLQFCTEDPACYGMLDMAGRRDGKSFGGACFLVEYISRTPDSHGGIQSKTNKDGRTVFAEKLIQPFRKLIDFFKPKYDTSQGNVPKKELRFFEPSVKGKKGATEDYSDVLELASWIDFESSVDTAYDGQKLARYMCDEVFKTVEVDVLKRHSVVKPCLEDSSRNIIGKALYTSTVEEIEGHIEKYIKLWNESNYSERNKNGRTISGLYRWFTPMQNVMFVDKYGFPDKEKALDHIQNEVDSIKDPRDKHAYLRKNPRNWREAFNTSNINCHYDPIKLGDRLSVLNFRSNNYERYKLKWDEDGKKVIKVKNPLGQFMFAWDFASEEDCNNVKERAGEWIPLNNQKFVIGIDPFDHNRRQDGTFSNGAAAVYMKYDAMHPDDSENFVCLYVGRPPTAKEFFEEMVKLCHYFGCPMLFENNKPTIGDHFKERGHGSFIIRDAKGNPGIAAHEKSHLQIVEETETFIDEHCHRVNFPELLTDWKDFNIEDTTKYDLAMASGYALIAASSIRRKTEKMKRLTGKADVNDLFRRYKLPKSKSKFSKSWRNSQAAA